MHHAQLHARLRIDGFNGFGQSAEPIHTRNEDILDASVLQLGEHRQPEFGSFVQLPRFGAAALWGYRSKAGVGDNCPRAALYFPAGD